MDFPTKAAKYRVEVKAGNITAGQLFHVMHTKTDQLGDRQMQKLLVAGYVAPQIAKTLREFKIQFIDTAGNVFINDPAAFIIIRGNKPQPNYLFVPKEGMFNCAGVQVVFALLCK